ncbi:MAG: hypothetical protein M0015_15665 [Betaproteobacteria bacterium]|nr:hypothetical protein [Betaproteobacteria bacterium]
MEGAQSEVEQVLRHAQALISAHRWHDAIAVLGEALRCSPDCAELPKNLGNALLGQVDAAAES